MIDVVVVLYLHRHRSHGQQKVGNVIAVKNTARSLKLASQNGINKTCDTILRDELFILHGRHNILSAAKLTVTLPDFVFATISLAIINGAVLPGIATVVMIISTSSHCYGSICAALAYHSLLISLVYPPAPDPSFWYLT